MWQDVKNKFHLLESFAGHLLYRFPSKKLVVIGVTGTSGKTTTAHMIYEVLKAAGYKVSLLSTIKAVVGGQGYDTGFHVTTPGRHRLAEYLKKAVDNGDKYFVLEVSSHALDQNRAGFVDFDIGVLTTLAHEHLDYHKTFLNYTKSKFILLHKAKRVVIPTEAVPVEIQFDIGYEQVIKKAITFGISYGDVTQKGWKFSLQLPGEFNTKNALAAAAVGKLVGIDEKIIKSTLEKFDSIPGRWEEIQNTKGFQIVIDFAHKPDALEEVLKTARSQIKKNGRVIVMFGCAGARDVQKRPMMGKIADKLADIIVLTDEDPRFEDPMKIIREIGSGIKNNESREQEKTLFEIPNRQEAIEFVIKKLARGGDVVLLLGKGHEQSMNYRGKEMSWDEKKVVLHALE